MEHRPPRAGRTDLLARRFHPQGGGQLYEAQLTTGKAAWEVARLEGFEFSPGIFFVGSQLTAQAAGRNGKKATTSRAKVVRSPIAGNPYGETSPGWKLYPTHLPDQFDREITAGRAAALGDVLLGTSDVLRAEQARDPELPDWQALVAGRGEIVVPAA